MKKRVLVAMSGGVDSSVSASLLKDQGFEVVGATLQVWDYSKNKDKACGTCCSDIDVQDARLVCQVLKIPFYVLNTEELFDKQVIQPFVSDYLQGKTPIPCTNCNTFLKFHYLVKKMEELECDFLATGHYAKIKKLEKGGYGLFTSSDSLKDQTYFLFTLKPELLPRLLFPVGSMSKSQVRDIALKKALPVFQKKDSTGICFAGKQGYKNFIEDYLSKKQGLEAGRITNSLSKNQEQGSENRMQGGRITNSLSKNQEQGLDSAVPKAQFPLDKLDKQSPPEKGSQGGSRAFSKKLSLPKVGLLKSFTTGKVLGEHTGIHNFTIGQRKGLGVNSLTPLYVVKIDPKSREVWLGQETDLYSHSAKVVQVNWLDKAQTGEKLTVKVRFHDEGTPARIYKKADSYLLQFEKPKKAVTPGQSAVFYRGRQILGGGTIKESLNQPLNPPNSFASSKAKNNPSPPKI